MKVRVLKRFGQWHWWCPECMGGDWGPAWPDAMHMALRHASDPGHTADLDGALWSGPLEINPNGGYRPAALSQALSIFHARAWDEQ